MMITLVADETLPAYGDCSRDPDVLAAGLGDLGHKIAGPIRVDGLGSPGDPTGLVTLLDPWLAATTEIVVSLGLASPVPAATLAQTQGVPLVLLLPADLLLATTSLPVGFGRVLCGHLPATCLIVESNRQRMAAEQLGAPPQSVFVVSPGLTLPDLSLPVTPTIPTSGPLRVLHVPGLPGDVAEEEFLAEVVGQLRRRRGDTNDTELVVVTEAAPPVVSHQASDVVVVTDQSSQATVTAMRAMAAGRPLLAADGPAIHDVATSVRHGVLARPGEVAEWVDKLEYLLADPALRSHLGRGARTRMETDLALPQTLAALDERLTAVASAWNYLATAPDPP